MSVVDWNTDEVGELKSLVQRVEARKQNKIIDSE